MARILWEVNSPGRLVYHFKTRNEAKEFAPTLTGHDYVEVIRYREGCEPNADEVVAIYQHGKLVWSK